MKTFRLLWLLHKWAGITLGAILVMSAVSGLLLLVKKDYDWIQPPTQRGTAGSPEQIAPLHRVYDAVFAVGDPRLQSEADIDRIDFRPNKRVFKVRSKHDDLEIQVDAVSLRTWQPAVRTSDWLERLHDGSVFGAWAHGYVMPIVALGLVFLTITGYLVWLWPIILKRRRARERALSRD